VIGFCGTITAEDFWFIDEVPVFITFAELAADGSTVAELDA